MTLEEAEEYLARCMRNRDRSEYERNCLQEDLEYWEQQVSETLDQLERLREAH